MLQGREPWAPVVVLLVLAGVGVSSGGCSNGTTPVCDDAGSCLILAPSDDGTGVGDAGKEAGEDAPAE